MYFSRPWSLIPYQREVVHVGDCLEDLPAVLLHVEGGEALQGEGWRRRDGGGWRERDGGREEWIGMDRDTERERGMDNSTTSV